LTKAGYQIGPHSAWYYTVNLLSVPNVYISGDDGDVVQMYGSAAGPNTYVSTPTYSYMVGPTGQFYVVSGVGGDVIKYNNVHGLGALYAYGHSMPGDQAWFYGSSGADSLVMSGSAYTYMSGTGFFNVAAGFTCTQAIAGSGQSMVYYLDSPGNDVYWGSAAASYMSGPGYFDAAYGFMMVYAQSFVGGTDYAYNYDPYHVFTAGRWVLLA